MVLSYHQFYHVAPQSARESIDQHGLRFQQGQRKWEDNASGGGNFMWTNLKDAHTYQQMANRASKDEESPNWTDFSGQNYDVYEVSIPKHSKIPIKEDPEFESAVKTVVSLPRRFIRRIS